MLSPSITLCTYTYNDAGHVDGLLASLAHWSLQPSEVIVVDDHSQSPYALPIDYCKQKASVIRHPHNSGPACAKNTGISAAQCDIILSLDCDIRLSERWLEQAVQLFKQHEKVGIVGAPIVSGFDDTVSGRYERHCASYEHCHEAVNFLTGGVWLLPRSVWQQTGGLTDYKQSTHEDHYFCNKVIKHGLTLHAALHLPPAQQVRRLHYTDILRRFWLWGGNHAIDSNTIKFLPHVLINMLAKHDKNVQYFSEKNEYELCYIELLSFLYFSLSFLGCINSKKEANAPHARLGYITIFNFLSAVLSGYNNISDLIIRDLTILQHKQSTTFLKNPCTKPFSAGNTTCTTDYEKLFQTLCKLWPSSLLQSIEESCSLLDDDIPANADFSFYRTL